MPYELDSHSQPAHEAHGRVHDDLQRPRRAPRAPGAAAGVQALKDDMRDFAHNRTRGHRTATLRLLAARARSLGVRLELRGAALGGMDLQGIDLRGANLAHAHLRGANLTAVDLRGANLREAKLEGAALIGTRLDGADLTGVLLDRPDALMVCRKSDTTILPASGRQLAPTGAQSYVTPFHHHGVLARQGPTVLGDLMVPGLSEPGSLPKPTADRPPERPPSATKPGRLAHETRTPPERPPSATKPGRLAHETRTPPERPPSATKPGRLAHETRTAPERPASASKPGRLAAEVRRPPESPTESIWAALAPLVERKIAEAGPQGVLRASLIDEAQRQLALNGRQDDPESFIEYGTTAGFFFLRGARIASSRVMADHGRSGVSAARRSAAKRADEHRADDPERRTRTHHAEGWATLDMLANEVGEQARGVYYTTEREREVVALKLVGGEFVNSTGDRASSPSLEQRSPEDVWKTRPAAATTMLNEYKQHYAPQAALDMTIARLRASPRLIFVMTSAGEFLAAESQLHLVHHSTLLAGGAVAGAGEIGLRDGKPFVISNESGHYRPGPAYLWQAVRQLQLNGVDIGSLKVEVRGAGELEATTFLRLFDPTVPETDGRHLSFDPAEAVEKIRRVHDPTWNLNKVMDALSSAQTGALSFDELRERVPTLPGADRLFDWVEAWIAEFPNELGLSDDGLRLLGDMSP